MKRILISVSSKGALSLLFRIAEHYIKLGCDIKFLLDEKNIMLQRYATLLEGKALFFDTIVEDFVKLSVFRRQAQAIKFSRIKNKALRVFLLDHYQKFSAAINLLTTFSPNLIIVAEDGIASNFVLLSAARKKKIPILDCPFGFGSRIDLENSLESKSQCGELIELQGEFSDLIKSKYPHWIKKGKFAGSLMFPPEFIVSLERNGITIPDPWVIHGGLADLIAVESKLMLEHYIKEGVSSKKLELVGTPYCDIMYDKLTSNRNAFAAYKGSRELKPHERTVLVCWPPSFDDEHGKHTEFTDYKTMAIAILQFLSKLPGVNLIISPHPAVSCEMIAFLKEHGFTVSESHVLELIPMCDIYFSCFSSSIRYAIACRKVVVNYNMYKLNLDDYCDVPGVFTMDSFEKMKEIMNLLMQDDEYRKYAKLLHEVSGRWGMLDGCNFQRLDAVVKKIAKKSKKRYLFGLQG